MTKEYKDLLSLVAMNGALNAEQAQTTFAKEGKPYDDKLDEMRLHFNEIRTKIEKNKPLTQYDFVILYTGAIVSQKMIQKNIDTWTAVVQAYNTDLLPKIYALGIETDKVKFQELLKESFGA